MRCYLKKIVLLLSLLFLFTPCIASHTTEFNDCPEPRERVSYPGSTSPGQAPLSDDLPVPLGGIAHAQRTSPKPSMGLVGGVKLFFTSLFEPFIDDKAQAFYQTQKDAIQNQGVFGYGKDFVMTQAQWIRNNPLDATFDTISLSGIFVFGHTNMAETYPQLLTAYQALAVARPVTAVLKDISSQDLEKWLPRLIEASAYSATLYLVAQFPVIADAASFNSYAEARRAYGGYGCSIDQQILSEASEVAHCLKESGSTLEICQAKLPDHPGLTRDLYVFTRHPSVTHPSLDPITVERIAVNQTCIQSALSPDSPVTQICYTGQLSPTSTFEITRLDGLSLRQGHEGLNSGESARHVGIHHAGNSCGLFNKAPASYDLGDKPLCFKSATESGGPVTQLCVDPTRPEVMTVKEVPTDSSMVFPKDGSPAFQVIDSGKTHTLDTAPDDGRPPVIKRSFFNPHTQCALNETAPLEDSLVEDDAHGFNPLTQCALDDSTSTELTVHDPSSQAPDFSDSYFEEEDDLNLWQEFSSVVADTTSRLYGIATKWWGRKWWFQRGTSLQKVN
ncbi:MAG: hypothetical protein H2057_06830 [Alphaproteobacteria bacterium]|nr:hypothetical protein [Alphaproteobacteria bacterium]